MDAFNQFVAEVQAFFAAPFGYSWDLIGHVLLTIVIVYVVYKILRSSIRYGITHGRRQRQAAKNTPRMFTESQKLEGHTRAGNRCEYSSGFTRCRQPSKHGDHFFPYVKGGNTSMLNFVAACEHHNLSKGAKLPKAHTRRRIASRRLSYFPAGDLTRIPGEWC